MLPLQGMAQLRYSALIGLARSLDVLDAVAVEGDRSSQDDKKHDHIRENAPTPTSMFLNSSSLRVAPLR